MTPTPAPRKRFSPLSLALLLLAGCANPVLPAPVPTHALAAPLPPAVGSKQQAVLTADDASGTASAAASPTAPSPPPASLGTTMAHGSVYDENGALVPDGTVHVTSLNTAVPFDATVNIVEGTYSLSGLPVGVAYSFTATRPNWTSRTRVVSVMPLSATNANVVDFGGTTSRDPGLAYFIASSPEMLSDEATTGDTFSYVLTFSAPFDATNQHLIEHAVRISATSSGGASISLQQGSYFGVDSNILTMSWDTTGTVLTIAFNAPLYAQGGDDETYTLQLYRAAGDDPIKDIAGDVLGYSAPSAGSNYNPFLVNSPLSLNGESTGEARWDATHSDNDTFTVDQDSTAPTLSAASVHPVMLNGVPSDRFALTFNEAMSVYGANASPITGDDTVTTGSQATSTAALDNYHFFLSRSPVTNVDVDTTPALKVGSAADGKQALNSAEVFTFDGSKPGVSVAPCPTDPKTLWIYVPSSFVPQDALFFKVEAENIEDPADNRISTDHDTDGLSGDNIQSGSF